MITQSQSPEVGSLLLEDKIPSQPKIGAQPNIDWSKISCTIKHKFDQILWCVINTIFKGQQSNKI